MNAATVSGPSRYDQLVELRRHARAERRVVLLGRGLPEPVRRRDVADLRQRQVERLVHARQPGEAAAPSETPWYPRQREMIFFFSGRPSRLLYIRTSLICVSLASEPELP